MLLAPPQFLNDLMVAGKWKDAEEPLKQKRCWVCSRLCFEC